MRRSFLAVLFAPALIPAGFETQAVPGVQPGRLLAENPDACEYETGVDCAGRARSRCQQWRCIPYPLYFNSFFALGREMEESPAETRDRYGYWVSIPTRWMDGDPYGHVNNAQYYSFVDTAVTRMLIDKQAAGAALRIHRPLRRKRLPVPRPGQFSGDD